MNTLEKIVLSVVVVIGLVGLGFWLVPKRLSQTPLDGMLDVSSPRPLPIIDITQTRHADVEGTVGCDVRLLYPQIDDDGTLSISSEAREKMNDAITKQVADFFGTNTVSLDEAATAFVTSCHADLTEAMSGTGEVMDELDAAFVNGWESEIGYNMKVNDGTYLSLGIANYVSTGGAHPNITELYFTFDVETGDVVTLRDILAEDARTAFVVKEKQWLVDTMADQLFEGLTSEFAAFIAAPTQEDVDRYLDDAMFYLTPTDIVTFYNPYTIAPYTTGPVEVVIAR